MSLEKQVSYSTVNTYSTLNQLTEKTRTIWMVFHGMGYLSKYFIRYFSGLNPEENYIIAPQAPSKYYQDRLFKYVGASWLTRENTVMETENVLNYVQTVFQEEVPEDFPNLIVLGYSQGVSIATRWLVREKINCSKLILHSGGIPKELKSGDFDFLTSGTEVIYLYGNNDPYITEARKTEEIISGTNLFGDRLKTVVFEGKHKVNTDFIKKLV